VTNDPNFFPDGETYNNHMARISRAAGERFLDWLALPGGLRWLDVGCGPGTFTELALDRAAPSAISAVDPSERTVAYAMTRPEADRIDYRQGDAMALPFDDDAFDVAAMALVIQYVPDRARAMSELSRVAQGGGTIGAYVWSGEKNEHPLHPMNDAIQEIGAPGPGRPGSQVRTIRSLVDLFEGAGLQNVDSHSIGIELEFADFETYWSSQPPEYRGMSDREIERLRALLQERLPTGENGAIGYKAYANAVRGTAA
jgi:SAM-dependent methyltransferase